MKLPSTISARALSLVISLVAVRPGAAITVTAVGCPNVAVMSLDKSISFYTTVLNFVLLQRSDTSRISRLAPGMPTGAKSQTAHLALGDECLELTEYLPPSGAPLPGDSQGNDRWFQHIAIVVSDMNSAYMRLREARAALVSSLPQTLPDWNPAAAGIQALYFRDPDGHFLELIHFPPGKGQSKWQISSEHLFRGIDHTALVISNTSRSLAFYRDNLHFHVTGESENYGQEQEHLSGVFNAHVVITSLRTGSGIGIELLEYLTPGSGRPIPSLQHVNDLACWQTQLIADESSAGLSGKVLPWRPLPDDPNGYRDAAWVQDPDGHLLKLEKRK